MTDRARLKALAHYVIWRAGKRKGFGATKLNKVLWFSDARHYSLTGFPITGATYIREKYGPVPKLIMPIRDELVSDGFIRLIKPLYEGDTTKFLPLQKPENLPFSTDELATVDYWLEHISEDHTATSISEFSHDYGWEIAPMGSIIPLSAFLTSRIREPNDIEKTAIIARAKELGLI